MEKKIELSLTIGNNTFTYSYPHEIIDSDVLVEAFVGLLVGHSYCIDTIIDSLKKYVIVNKLNYNESKDKN